MSTGSGLNGIKDLPYFLVGSALLLGIIFLLNKGCAHLSGSDKQQEFQVQQLEALKLPDNTNIFDKFDSTPGYDRAWITYSYKTHSTRQDIFDFYLRNLKKNNWVCYKGCNAKTLDMNNYDPEDGILWYKKENYLQLRFGAYENNILKYYIMISWERNRRMPEHLNGGK